MPSPTAAPSPFTAHAPGTFTRRLGGLAWGADYNPEQWPAEVVDDDIELMRRAGVTMVTVGVFSWGLLEPTPGAFDFAWMDRVVDRLEAAGIGIDLATATASPPAWLHAAHPEILPMLADGTVLGFGSRQAWCPSSPIVRTHQLRLVSAMADHYGDRDGLVMWHVGNEFGCHVAQCHCPVSTDHFRRWLRDRYGEIDALNAAWGTAFWSQHYTEFAQVDTPKSTPTLSNPTQVLDFRRFSSDALLDCHRAERDLLRKRTPDVPITTNFMVGWTFDELDYADWAPEVDLVSNDHYLRGDEPDPHTELAFSADRTRGLAHGHPWLLMEHSTSAVNWQPTNVAKAPGELARNSLAHIARGSQGAMFFQWRQSRAGAERFHSAMVPHAGPDTRIFREVVEMGALLGRLDAVAETVTEPARVAILTDAEAEWALARDALPVTGLSHVALAGDIHRALWTRNIACDVIGPHDSFTDRDVIMVPALMLVDAELGPRLEAAATAGAQVLVTFASGLSDRNDHVVLGGYPGAFRSLLGVTVEEFTPPRTGTTIRLDTGTTATRWFEDVRVDDADVLTRSVDGPRPGGPAITRADRGEGAAWYVATWLDRPGWDDLLDAIVLAAGVHPVADVDPGMEAVRRIGDGGSWLFLLNHTDGSRGARTSGHDMVTERDVDGELVVPAGGVAVVHEANDRAERG